MLKKELLQLLQNIDDEGSIDEVLSQSDLVKSFIQKGLTLDNFKSKIDEKDFRAYIDSLNDKHFEKALKTWKDNNLEKEFEPWIQEKYPDLIKDQVKQELAALKKQLADEKAANARKDLLNQAIQYATEKKIPTSLVEKFLDEDLEKTKTNLDGFIETINPWVSAQVDERLGASSWIPGNSGTGSKKGIGESFAEEFNNETTAEGPNPWA